MSLHRRLSSYQPLGNHETMPCGRPAGDRHGRRQGRPWDDDPHDDWQPLVHGPGGHYPEVITRKSHTHAVVDAGGSHSRILPLDATDDIEGNSRKRWNCWHGKPFFFRTLVLIVYCLYVVCRILLVLMTAYHRLLEVLMHVLSWMMIVM